MPGLLMAKRGVVVRDLAACGHTGTATPMRATGARELRDTLQRDERKAHAPGVVADAKFDGRSGLPPNKRLRSSTRRPPWPTRPRFEHETKYVHFIQRRGVGDHDQVASSPASYVSYLNSVCKLLRIDISPQTVADET